MVAQILNEDSLGKITKN